MNDTIEDMQKEDFYETFFFNFLYIIVYGVITLLWPWNFAYLIFCGFGLLIFINLTFRWYDYRRKLLKEQEDLYEKFDRHYRRKNSS